MNGVKAPGPNGFIALFYRNQWFNIKDSLHSFVTNCFNGSLPIAAVNGTLISLIPNVPHSETITQFRPINLCNVNYKILTKILVQRIQPFVSKLIGEEQASFVPGRQITNNIVIVQEIVHSMHSQKGKNCSMAIKVDLEKAYDRLYQDFIHETLLLASLPESLINLIMNCVTTHSMQVVWDGEVSHSFNPSRGIRQRDPLSLYLFVICIEQLARLIKDRFSNGSWKPLRV